MKKKLETFFDNQIEEHKNVLELCEKKLKKPFLDIVEICVSSLAKKKKFYFLETEVVPLMLSIFQQNLLFDFQKTGKL